MFNFTDISIVVVAGIAVVIGVVALAHNPFKMSEKDYIDRIEHCCDDGDA